MKARVKATGEFIEVIPSIHSKGSYDGNDGYTYTEESLIMLEDEPNYWEKLKHQYAGMAMQGILANCNHQLWERETNSEGIAKRSYEIATALVNRLKEEKNDLDSNTRRKTETLY